MMHLPLLYTATTRALTAMVVDNSHNVPIEGIGSSAATATSSILTNNNNDNNILYNTILMNTGNTDGATVHDDSWMYPLLLSCMAGGSTCIGAGIVFCFTPQQIKKTMSFSLSLAASVMITISIISIGPECWDGIIVTSTTTNVIDLTTTTTAAVGSMMEDNNGSIVTTMMNDNPTTTTSIIIIHWWLLFERLLSFSIGCGGYFLLSKLLNVLPEPDSMVFLMGNGDVVGNNNNKKVEDESSSSASVIGGGVNVVVPAGNIDDDDDDKDVSGTVALIQRQCNNRNSSISSNNNDKWYDALSDGTTTTTSINDENQKSSHGGTAVANNNDAGPLSEGNDTTPTTTTIEHTETTTTVFNIFTRTSTPKTRNGHQQQQRQRRKPKNNSSSGAVSDTTTTTTTTYPSISTSERASSYDSTVSDMFDDGLRPDGYIINDKDNNNNNSILSSSSAVASTTSITTTSTSKLQRQRSWRVAMLLFVSLLCHNFPEGLCVAASAKESHELGMTVAIGILIHNVPEGIAISVPCMAARPDRPWLAFWLASISGLAEPIGAIVALVVLQSTTLPLENVLASVAGVMCMVALLELYPEAVRSLPRPTLFGGGGTTTSTTIGGTGSLSSNPTGTALVQLQQPLSNDKSKQRNMVTTIFTIYRPIVWGTLVGIAMMVATEWYL